MTNRPSKQSIIGKLEDKGEKLNRINYVLNFIFDKQDSETVTGKIRSSVIGKLDSTFRVSEPSVAFASTILPKIFQTSLAPPAEVKPLPAIQPIQPIQSNDKI